MSQRKNKAVEVSRPTSELINEAVVAKSLEKEAIMNRAARIGETWVRNLNNDLLRLRLIRVGNCICLAALLCCGASLGLSQNKVFTNDDVLKMVKAGFKEETIIEAIHANEPRYDTSVEALVTLKNAGVSERVISTMLAAARAGASAPKIDGEGGTAPGEIGVYALKDGRYVELASEAVDWRSKFFNPTTTVGNLTKNRLTAQLKSPQSPLHLSGAVELLIVCPEGVSATQYHFLRAEPNKDKREFRVDFQVLNNGVLLALGGNGKSAVQFEAEKVGVGKFRILIRELGKGEYAFLPPGTVAHPGTSSVDKMYTFGLR